MNAQIEVASRYRRGLALGDIAAELGLEYDATDGVLYLPGYVADDGDFEVQYPDATSGLEAATAYVTDGEWGDEWKNKTFAHEVAAWRPALQLDDDGELCDVQVELEHHLVRIEPDEPECGAAEDGQHGWASPHQLVGGCSQNPGVHGGRGCSVSVLEVCLLCGLSRTSRTSSQGHETAYDYDSTEYGDDDVSLDDLHRYHDGRVPAGLCSDSELAELLRSDVDDRLALLGHDSDNIECDESIYEWTVAVRTDECEARLAALREHLGWCSSECRHGSSDEDWQEITVVLPQAEG